MISARLALLASFAFVGSMALVSPGWTASSVQPTPLLPTFGPCSFPAGCTGSGCAGCVLKFWVEPDPENSGLMQVRFSLICNGQVIIDGPFGGIKPGGNEDVTVGQTPGCKVHVSPCSGTWGGTSQCSDVCGSCSG
jgi:hypothetical protein